MNKTSIEYLTHTWNPIVMRCTRVSQACDFCWHLARVDMLAKNPTICSEHRAIYSGNAAPAIKLKELEAPVKRKKPAVIGVQFMGDLFHENIDFLDGVDRVFAEMENAPWHTFIVLTKRPERALEYHNYHSNWEWPENVWLGVTVENNDYLDRIGYLLQIPAKIRFISFEPLLGPIDASHYIMLDDINGTHEHFIKHDWGYDDWSGGFLEGDSCYDPKSGISWAIVGGETGPKARPMHPDWARALRDQCQAAEIPFFFKHFGEWAWAPFAGNDKTIQRICRGGRVEPIDYTRKGIKSMRSFNMFGTECVVSKIGKKAAGRTLDNREWNEYPKVRSE